MYLEEKRLSGSHFQGIVFFNKRYDKFQLKGYGKQAVGDEVDKGNEQQVRKRFVMLH